MKDLATFSNEQIDPKNEPDRIFKYIQIQNIDSLNYKISSSTSITGTNAPGRAKMLIKTGDILVPVLGGSLKSIAIVPKELNNEVATNGFAVLRISDENLRYYVFYYLTTYFAQMQIERHLTGAIMPSISKVNLKNILIPLPDPAIQEKFAEKIKDMNIKIEELQKQAFVFVENSKKEFEKIILDKKYD